MSRDDGHGHEAIDPALIALERALGGLEPLADRGARDRILYRAGAASSRSRRGRSGGVWMGMAALLGIVAMGEGALLARRPVVERVVVVSVPVVSPQTGTGTSADSGASPRLLAVGGVSPLKGTGTPAVKPSGEPVPFSSRGGIFQAGTSALPQTPAGLLSWQVAQYGLDGLPASPPPVWGRGEGGGTVSAFQMREELLHEFGMGGA